MAITINTKDLEQLLEVMPCEQNIMLVGGHGIGKSRIITEFYENKGMRVVPLFLGQMSDPGDLIGLPRLNEDTGKTEFMPPYWFPTDDKPIVLFLDELNRARPEMLQAVMDLALNRKLAGRELPAGSRIMSAVNDGEEYQVGELDPALVSRFNIYTFAPTIAEWLLWAQKQGIDSRVTSFIENNSDYLDAKLNSNANSLDPTPDRRAWERVSNSIKGMAAPNEFYKKVVAGIVGAKAAARFFEGLKESHLVQGSELLLKWDKVKKQLDGLALPDFTIVNDNLYRFIELKEYKDNDVEKMATNLENYLNWLVDSNHTEAMAHFVSIFSDATYPEANIFIMTKNKNLYRLITNYVKML